MSKKQKFFLNDDTLRVILIVLGSIFSTVVLTLSIFAMIKIQENDYVASSTYLFGVFLALGLSRLVNFLRERTKITFIRFLVLLIFDVALGILVFFTKDNTYFYSLVGGFFCVTIVVSRIFKIIQKHTFRDILLNAILIVFAILLAIGLFVPYQNEAPFTPVLVVCFLVSITAFYEVLSSSFSQLRVKVLVKIVFRTFALEIILGMITMIVASALVFAYVEKDAATGLNWSFGDGLWYAFAVVTTIGFGDFSAVTPIGRVLTVILGVYGLIVVAVITSIIVNFYNETMGKRDAKEIQEIKDEERKK